MKPLPAVLGFAGHDHRLGQNRCSLDGAELAKRNPGSSGQKDDHRRFAAFSGTGKTTLLMQLIPLLRAKGLRSGLIKHGHHTFEIDTPGKDSDLLRQAGTVQVVVASAQRTLLINASDRKPELQTLVHQVASSELDIILVEGFKHHLIPKIELHRPSLGYSLLCQKDRAIIAVAADAPLPIPISIPLLDLNDPPAIAAFIHSRFLAGRI